MAFIPYGRQNISQKDIDAVVDVLNSDFLTQGPVVPAFEKALAQKCQSSYAVAVNSATSALHLACLALGVNKEHSVWTSPISFVASANCARYCGAQVDFVDIDPSTYNMDPKALEKKLEETPPEARPLVVIPVHMCGQSCDMEPIYKLSQKYGFHIIEDASHAIGAQYQQEPVGSCQYSDITVFSFHPVKIITSGEGGMAVTQDKALYERMGSLRTHGITKKTEEMQSPSPGPWYYEQLELGYNYRMTDIQAALGLSQMRRLDAFIKQRHERAAHYQTLLSHLPITLPKQSSWSYSSFHLYIIQIDPQRTICSRKDVFMALKAAGIGVNVHYMPIYHHPYYQSQGNFKALNYPASETYYEQAITLPLFPDLTYEQQVYITKELEKAFQI